MQIDDLTELSMSVSTKRILKFEIREILQVGEAYED